MGLLGGSITGNRTGSGDIIVGGLVGFNNGSISHSYATGAVTGENTGSGSGHVFVGGLVGNNNDGGIINSYFNTETTGVSAGCGNDFSCAGVTGKTTAEMMAQATFQPGANDWDFTNIWGIIEGQSTPYFLWQYPAGTTPEVVSGMVTGANAGVVNGLLDGQALAGMSVGANGFFYGLLAPGSFDNSTGLFYIENGGASQTINSLLYADGLTGAQTDLVLSANTFSATTQATSLSSLNAAIDSANLTGLKNSLHHANITTQGAFVIDEDWALQGNLSLNSQGAMAQTAGALTVAGTTQLTSGGNITLNSAGNDFVGAVNLTGGAVQLADSNALALGAVDVSALTVTSHGGLILGSGSIDGELVANSNGGAISQAGALSIAGVSSFDAGTGSITLNNAGNDFVGAVNLTGNTAQLTDRNALTLGTVDVNHLVLQASGNITAVAPISVDSFVLNGGQWRQVGSSLPAFAASSFSLNPANATFVRALGGNGTAANPYQLTDVYGLQGMASYSLLNQHFVLANNIDASGTASWNSGQGFAPIGTNLSNAFTGTFDGLGHTINELTINRTNEAHVGLFGLTDGSTISNVGLLGGAVTGTGSGVFVGGLVGANYGSISNSYATGVVMGIGTGLFYVGGLVGYNTNASITNSITNSYATGAVTGTSAGNVYVGGLVGYNNGSISNSYFNTDTTGQTNGIGSNTSAGEVSVIGGCMSDVCSNGGTVNLSKLDTFLDAGWDISATGGDSTVWRIYEGHTAPLLRSFLQQVTVTVDPITGKTYDGTVANGNFTYTSSNPNALLLGDATYHSSSANAGTYSVADGNLLLSGLYSDQQGYDISYVGGALTITPKQLTVTGLAVANRAYNGLTDATDDITNWGTVDTGIAGETLILNHGSASFADKNVGSHVVTVTGYTLADDTGVASNYVLTSTTATTTANITPRLVTVTVDAGQTKVYGDADPASFSYSHDALVAGDSFSGALTRDAGENAGSYAITQGDLDLGSNYDLTFVGDSFVITPRGITVTVDAGQTKIYGQADPASFSYSHDALVAGDSFSGALVRDAGENVGSYAITQGNLALSTNYTLTFNGDDFVIEPIPSLVADTALAAYAGAQLLIAQAAPQAQQQAVLIDTANALAVPAVLTRLVTAPAVIATPVIEQAQQRIAQMPVQALQFALDGAQTASALSEALKPLAALLQQNPELTVTIIGHTDNSGSEAYNSQLSQQRAQAVADELQAQGVAAQQLSVQGRGDSQPTASNTDEEGRQQNRRVELQVHVAGDVI